MASYHCDRQRHLLGYISWSLTWMELQYLPTQWWANEVRPRCRDGFILLILPVLQFRNGALWSGALAAHEGTNQICLESLELFTLKQTISKCDLKLPLKDGLKISCIIQISWNLGLLRLEKSLPNSIWVGSKSDFSWQPEKGYIFDILVFLFVRHYRFEHGF